MKLNNLYLKNFKGIREFSTDVKGINISILGKNGTDKTTVFDVFLWVRFDNDGNNISNFKIKTLDNFGEPNTWTIT
ncbi:hypothetical protein KQI88_14470 [Alkaliphilus sp. MSJ-5]|uniref:AAA domain-containing protein n=1 Tax=Alkaliphilus flagellatus TaxID=2841507 RepID=A0ABS6G5G8_9FIRM|nr:hypothetical protein [Alkaliphilus flagellatus]MBU5677624.1 hypothetical protein [Alkaliphilus flagellatus]